MSKYEERIAVAHNFMDRGHKFLEALRMDLDAIESIRNEQATEDREWAEFVACLTAEMLGQSLALLSSITNSVDVSERLLCESIQRVSTLRKLERLLSLAKTDTQPGQPQH